MSPYASTHVSPQGPGDSRPTALQIVKDEKMENQLKGKAIVITGVSSGLGIETVRALSVTGARFYLTARNLDKAMSALSGIFDADRMELIEMDQESLASVRAAAKKILDRTDQVNILIANAGVMAVPTLQLTKDGHEMQFGTNHLSHFLLFELLKPALLAAATPDFHSRVVVVASSAHLRNGINASDNYNFQKGGYEPFKAYSQSKTANVYMANEIERRYGDQGLHATSLHPGGILTPLARHLPAEAMEAINTDVDLLKTLKDPEQGAATTVWAAVGKDWEGKGGRYLENCAEASITPTPGKLNNGLSIGYATYAYDAEQANRLWVDSLKMVEMD